MNELMVIDKLTAIDLFEQNKVEGIVLNIQEKARELVPDVSSDKGRKDIGDLVNKIRKCSKILDELGKNHVAILKALPKQVDSKRKKMRDDLKILYDEVRIPLTEWEDEEKASKERILNKINAMMAMPGGGACERISNKILAKVFLDEIQATVIDDSFGDSIEWATKTKAENELIVKGVIANFEIEEKAEVERVEAAKLGQIERDKRIAKEAKEQAERAAEQTIKAAKDAEELAVKNAKIANDKAEQDIIDGYAREAAAAKKAKQDAKDAKSREKLAADQAKHSAKLKAEQAVQAEKERAEREKQDEINAAAARARNTKHKGKINKEARDALIDLSLPGEFKISQTQAELIVTLINKGKIPHVSIKY